jgi:hypothetical protein
MKITTSNGRVCIQADEADVSILMEPGETEQQALLRSARLLYDCAEFNIKRAQFRKLAAATLGPPLDICCEMHSVQIYAGHEHGWYSVMTRPGDSPIENLRRRAAALREEIAEMPKDRLFAALLFEQAALQLENDNAN